MTDYVARAAERRADAIRASLARHRLILVQMGAAFDVLRPHLLESLNGTTIQATDIQSTVGSSHESSTLVVTGVESLAMPGSGTSMGSLREIAIGLMDAGRNICLISRAPRVAFSSIPGSSILEDAALFPLPLLAADECLDDAKVRAGWNLPAIGLVEDAQIEDVFVSILSELGAGVLSALDHCLFEVDPRGPAGIAYLSHRDKEGIRCAGLVDVDGAGHVSLVVSNRLLELKTALSDVISATTVPARDLAPVVSGLWFMERTIRAALRAAAKTADGSKWRSTIVGGGLAKEVLDRARLDSNISAVSIKELRDPLEWLTLGELLGVVKSSKFDGLGIDSVVWKKFAEQVMPIRNRISHMRDLKSNDEEIVGMWVSLIGQQFR